MPSRRGRAASRKRRGKSVKARAPSAAQFERILANLDEITYEVASPGDPMAGTVVFVSRQVEVLVGHRPEEFKRDPTLWFQLVHRDDVPSVTQATREMYESRRPGTRRYRLRHRSTGQYRWIEDRVVPRLGAGGRVVGYYGAARDVTDRIAADAHLRQSEERFRTFFQNIPEPAYLWRRTGDDFELATHNTASVTYTDGQVTSLVGRRLRDLYAERPDIVADVGRCLAEQSVLTRQMQYRFTTGKVVDLEVWYVPIPPDTVVVHTADVTERRRAEAALQESEDRYRDLVEHSQDLICIHDLDGLIISINPWAARMLGYEPAELLGMSVRDALAPEVRHEFDQYLADIRTAGAAQGLMLMQTRTGERRIWEYRNTLRTEGVAAPVVRGMAHDITGRKRAEDMVRASRDRLRALAVELHNVREAERAAIAREIHDEFGQVLTGLKMDLTWLIDRSAASPKDVPERIGAMLELVDRSVDAVRRMASDLRPAVLDDLGIAAAIEWLAEDFSKHSGIECHCDVLALEPALGPDRATAVFRIAQEALTNVARHSGARHVEIIFTATDDAVSLKVRDDGKGINERQVASVRSIGLIGMRERAGSLGGRVHVRPGIDRGTIVTLEMPIKGPSLPAAAP